MTVSAGSVDLGAQRLLAVWAVKTVYLLELAARQQYPGKRQVEGYEPSISPNVAYRGSMIHYAPSSAGLPTPSGGTVVGQFATLAIGFIVFQMFTVDYVEAEAQQAEIWITDPPKTIAHALPLIWPVDPDARRRLFLCRR